MTARPGRQASTAPTGPGPEQRPVPPVPARRRPARPAGGTLARRAPFVLLVVAMLVGTTLGLLFLNTAIAVDSLRATQMRVDNAERAEDVERLQREVISGSTASALAAAAEEAGLVPAGTAGFLVIGPDGRVSLRGTPQPAEAPEPAAPPPGQAPGQAPVPAPGAPEAAAPQPAGAPAGDAPGAAPAPGEA